jgi:FkbM family methyltransferase
MSQTECDKLIKALSAIGRNAALRERLLTLCREAEKSLAAPDFSVRDEITGPIIDALHADVGIMRKTLSTGVVFDFHYRSKIAREFVMSPDEKPDHVWEPQTTRLLVHLAANASHVVIGGAYSGDQAILVADRLAETGGICHAFEPNGEQLEMLQRNARNNGLTNIRFERRGLWLDDQTMLRLVGDDSFAHPEVAAPNGAGDDDCFPTTSINRYGADQGIERIGLIMLDIEGAELAALKGADQYLSQPADRAPTVVFEVHRDYVDWSDGLENTEIVRLMTDHGYRVFAMRDFNSNVPMGDLPIELVPPERTYLDGPPHGFNMLAVKNPAIIENDLFRICHDVSPKLLWHKEPRLHHPTDML